MAVEKGESVKSIVLFVLLSSLLLAGAYNQVAGTPREAAQSPDRSVNMPAPAVSGNSGKLPAKLSEYVSLHQTRYESIPVHAMAGVNACPE